MQIMELQRMMIIHVKKKKSNAEKNSFCCCVILSQIGQANFSFILFLDIAPNPICFEIKVFGTLPISKNFLDTLPLNRCSRGKSVKYNETLKTRFLPLCLSARDGTTTYDSIVLSGEISALVIVQRCLIA